MIFDVELYCGKPYKMARYNHKTNRKGIISAEIG